MALARYADQAWATQLADLAPQRRIATLVACTHLLATSARDDVIDIFDVVFGDLQRAATHRGQKRRAGELRDYDRAVAAVHAQMRSLLNALDDPLTLEEVLAAFRTQRAGMRIVACDIRAHACALEGTSHCQPVRARRRVSRCRRCRGPGPRRCRR